MEEDVGTVRLLHLETALRERTVTEPESAYSRKPDAAHSLLVRVGQRVRGAIQQPVERSKT